MITLTISEKETNTLLLALFNYLDQLSGVEKMRDVMEETTGLIEKITEEVYG